MNLLELTRRFRVMARDTVEPFLFSDEDVAVWLTDGEAQAAIRARLLLEEANPDVCEIVTTPGQHTYPLHPALYELTSIRFKPDGDTRSTSLELVTREWLDKRYWYWRDNDMPEVRFAVQGETTLRMVPPPKVPGTLLLEGYRLPLEPLAMDADEPEIHQASHEKLIYWALYRAFSVVDSETIDKDRASMAEAEFSRHFGLAVDADMRRSTRADEVQHNVVYVP